MTLRNGILQLAVAGLLLALAACTGTTGDTTAPKVAFTTGDTNVTSATSLTLTVVASDEGNIARVAFYRKNASSSPTNKEDLGALIDEDDAPPYEVTVGFTRADNGAWAFTAVAFDMAGNSASSTVSVTVDILDLPGNDAPTFTSSPIRSATVGSSYRYRVTAADPDAGDTLAITAPQLPPWLTLDDGGNGTATLEGTPTAGDVGDHEVELRVTDAASASDSQAFSITVRSPGAEGILLSSPAEGQNSRIGQQLTVEAVVTDPENATAIEVDYGDGNGFVPMTPQGSGSSRDQILPAAVYRHTREAWRYEDLGTRTITVRATNSGGGIASDSIGHTVVRGYTSPFAISTENAASYIELSTPDPDAQHTNSHPSVVYHAGGMHGYRAFMMGTQDIENQPVARETVLLWNNPLRFSDAGFLDGPNWERMTALESVAVDPPLPTFNSDPDLVADPGNRLGDTLIATWRESDVKSYDRIWYAESSDGGVSWGPRTATGLQGPASTLISPQFMYDPDDNTYYCWVSNYTLSPNAIQLYGADAMTGPWTYRGDVAFETSLTNPSWGHFTVERFGPEYWWSLKYGGQIVVGVGRDPLWAEVRGSTFLGTKNDGWQNTEIYKPSFFLTESGMALAYSAGRGSGTPQEYFRTAIVAVAVTQYGPDFPALPNTNPPGLEAVLPGPR